VVGRPRSGAAPWPGSRSATDRGRWVANPRNCLRSDELRRPAADLAPRMVLLPPPRPNPEPRSRLGGGSAVRPGGAGHHAPRRARLRLRGRRGPRCTTAGGSQNSSSRTDPPDAAPGREPVLPPRRRGHQGLRGGAPLVDRSRRLEAGAGDSPALIGFLRRRRRDACESGARRRLRDRRCDDRRSATWRRPFPARQVSVNSDARSAGADLVCATQVEGRVGSRIVGRGAMSKQARRQEARPSGAPTYRRMQRDETVRRGRLSRSTRVAGYWDDRDAGRIGSGRGHAAPQAETASRSPTTDTRSPGASTTRSRAGLAAQFVAAGLAPRRLPRGAFSLTARAVHTVYGRRREGGPHGRWCRTALARANEIHHMVLGHGLHRTPQPKRSTAASPQLELLADLRARGSAVERHLILGRESFGFDVSARGRPVLAPPRPRS